jgi:hypothetical protein
MSVAMATKLLTPEQLAERLGLAWPNQNGWIYARSREWVASNGQRGIPTVKLGRYYRYRVEEIDRWLEQVQNGEAEA